MIIDHYDVILEEFDSQEIDGTHKLLDNKVSNSKYGTDYEIG